MKRFAIIFVLLLFPSLLFANGSPINVSEVYSTGNIEMMKKQNISLEEEIVSVVIDGDYADVNIEYKFKNNGGADIVAYGFPVDRYYEYEQEVTLPEKPLTNFTIKDDSGSLKVSKHTPRSESEGGEHLADDANYQKRLREWFVAEIPFKEHETKIVKVSYRVKNRLDDWVYTKSFRPEFSDRTFIYQLIPSQNWGNGIVRKCTFQIDLRTLLKKDGIIKEISPKGYVNRKGILIWEYSNLDLKDAEDIRLVYDNSANALSKYIADERIPVKYISYSKASSVLKTDEINKYNYDPKNLFDGDLNTAWVEGVKGHGEAEWIEFELGEDFCVTAIGIINGYTKREALYYANNRIKKINLNVEFSATEYSQKSTETTYIELKQKQFNDLNKNVQAPFISWLADYGDGFRPVKRIRLTIMEVFPGTKYDDTCISELYILGYIPESVE